jgi:hypothetical protein
MTKQLRRDEEYFDIYRNRQALAKSLYIIHDDGDGKNAMSLILKRTCRS